MKYASLEEMQSWAHQLMEARSPDVIIGDDYLRRWWIAPRNQGSNVYLHEILRSDDDHALHDHPWDWTTHILDGGYIEHTPEGTFERRSGDIISKRAADLHRLELQPGGRAVTLFVTGPKSREWGFAFPEGWRHWRDVCPPEETITSPKPLLTPQQAAD